jgi:ankyrin repeat protein
MKRENIFSAIRNDDTAFMEQWSKEFDVNFSDNDDFDVTPLIYASMGNNAVAAKWLLDNGADMYAQNIFDDTAFHMAAKKGFLDIVKSFCEHGVNIDVVGQEGFTSLNYAVNFEFDDVAAYLIGRGASIDIPDDVFHKTPLDRIREKKKYDLLALIEKRT